MTLRGASPRKKNTGIYKMPAWFYVLGGNQIVFKI
jgi:hypothetical protein